MPSTMDLAYGRPFFLRGAPFLALGVIILKAYPSSRNCSLGLNDASTAASVERPALLVPAPILALRASSAARVPRLALQEHVSS